MDLKAQNCRAYSGISDIVEVTRSLASIEHVLLGTRTLETLPDGRRIRRPFDVKPSDLVHDNYEVTEVTSGEEELRFIFGPEGATIPVLLELDNNNNSSDHYLSCSIRFQMHTRAYSEAYGVCYLREETDELIDFIAERFSVILNIIYHSLSPAFSFLDQPVGFTRIAGDPILDRQLQAIYWQNYFGPPYVEEYGKDFLLNAPGWKKKELDDGGVFLQLGPKITSTEEGPSREEVLDYFKDVGVKYVTWPHEDLG
ncbi:MAG: hypothetical protein ACLFWD_02795 [Anaerolineales bacterium]